MNHKVVGRVTPRGVVAALGERGPRSATAATILMFLLGCATMPKQPSNDLLIAANGRSEYRIVLPLTASPAQKYAAEELQRFIREMSGASLSIISETERATPREILLGNARNPSKIDWQKLGDEGYSLRTVGEKIIVAGSPKRGTLYGVYALLEEQWGCRWFSSKVSRIPKRQRLTLPSLDTTYVPPLEYREPFYTDAFDGDWAARNRMNSAHSRLESKHGGKIMYQGFVHTFNELVPLNLYDSHPEYFPLIKGKRTNGYVQRCLTHPDVVRIATENVRKWLREHPEANIVSVSQNDTYNYCECIGCAALDTVEGSHAGTMLAFVNQVATAIEKEYPNVAIDTLAYQYTRNPTKKIRPRPNVIVRLCSIECCFAHPLASDECPENRKFREDMIGWSKLTQRLYVWDYVTNFAHYLMPFPNFDTLAPNVKFFTEHGVVGIFEEGNYSIGGGGEFAELRAYVLAKLLWNPNSDAEAVMNEFLDGYYGRAAQPIRGYIALARETMRQNGHLTIYMPPTAKYLTTDFLDKADKLFDEAERLADNEDFLMRVRIARLPIDYVRLSRAKLKDSPDYAMRARRFTDTVREAKISDIREGGGMQQFLDSIKPTP